MMEVLNFYGKRISESQILSRLSLEAQKYFVFSAHREENVENENDEYQVDLRCEGCGKIVCYADDCTYTYSEKDPIKLQMKIEKDFKKISEYMINNKLFLNSDKTHLLVMTTPNKHRIHNDFGIQLDTGNELIKGDTFETLLGGIISNDLKWKQNLRDNPKSLIKCLTTRLKALAKISRIASFKTRKMIGNGIFLSKLIYLIQVWGGTSDFLLSSLQIMQNKAARYITKLGSYTPVETLLTQCGWLSVQQLVVYHSLNLILKQEGIRNRFIFIKSSQNIFLT